MNNRRAFLKTIFIGSGSGDDKLPCLLIHSSRAHLPLEIHKTMSIDSLDSLHTINQSFDIESIAMAKMHHVMLHDLIELTELFSAVKTLDDHLFDIIPPLQTVLIEAPRMFSMQELVQKKAEVVQGMLKETLSHIEPLLASEQSWYVPLSVPLLTRTVPRRHIYPRYARSRL